MKTCEEHVEKKKDNLLLFSEKVLARASVAAIGRKQRKTSGVPPGSRNKEESFKKDCFNPPWAALQGRALNYSGASGSVTSNVSNIPTEKEEKKANARVYGAPKNLRRTEGACQTPRQKQKTLGRLKDHMLSRRNRLPLSSEKERTRRFEFSLEGEFLKLRFRRNGLERARGAIVVSKKTIALASARNRVKRALTGTIEGVLDQKKGYDIYVWIKKAVPPPFEKNRTLLSRELTTLIGKIGVRA